MGRTANATRVYDSDTALLLRETLSSIGNPAGPPWGDRDTPARSYEELVERLACEIDQTVLPRKLALVEGSRVVCSLVLSNRRLIEMTAGNADINSARNSEADPDAVARGYAQALQKLIAEHGALHLRRAGRAVQTASQGNACSAARLSGYADTKCFDDQLKAFLKLLHATSLGWIYRADGAEAVAHDPQAETFERLLTLDSNILTQSDDPARPARLNRSAPICTAMTLSNEAQSLIASDGKDRLVAAIPQSQLEAALALWQQVYGRPGHQETD